MEWLNYHHLYYFWLTAREGTLTGASQRLRLAPSTVSAQIRSLEKAIGKDLFFRQGRNLVLTDEGRLALQYANEIFRRGQELTEVLQGRAPATHLVRLRVGVTDVLPKRVAFRLLAPALAIEQPVKLSVEEGRAEGLAAKLAVHELDLVLCDESVGLVQGMKVETHRLCTSTIGIFAAPSLADRIGGPFPAALDGQPFLIPADGHIRRALQGWFQGHGINPWIAGEFDDLALLKAFGEAGAGAFAVPTIVADQMMRQYGVVQLGEIDGAEEIFFALTRDREPTSAAVQAILSSPTCQG